MEDLHLLEISHRIAAVGLPVVHLLLAIDRARSGDTGIFLYHGIRGEELCGLRSQGHAKPSRHDAFYGQA